MFHWICLFLCVLTAVLCKAEVPVLMWGVKRPALPALYNVSTETFEDIIEPILHKHMIFVYVENNLSTKDFLCRWTTDNNTVQSCYEHMQKLRPSNYYARVNAPLKALQNIAVSSVQWHQLDDRSSVPQCELSTVHIYNLTVTLPNQQRELLLAQHDREIAHITEQVNCSALHIYTAYNSIKVQMPAAEMLNRKLLHKTLDKIKIRSADDGDVRQHEAAASDKVTVKRKPIYGIRKRTKNKPYNPRRSDINEYLWRSPYFVARFENVLYYQVDKYKKLRSTPKELIITEMTSTLMRGSKVGILVNFTSDPNFSFEFSRPKLLNACKVDCVYVGGELFGKMPVAINFGTSHVCNRYKFYGQDGSMLFFKYVQYEVVPDGSGKDPNFSFGPPRYCSGAFPIGTINGLLISAFLLLMCGAGIWWITDIGSNATMDDPFAPELFIKVDE